MGVKTQKQGLLETVKYLTSHLQQAKTTHQKQVKK